MKKSTKILLIVLLVLLLLAAAAVGGYVHYRNTHIFVEGAIYEKDAASLDLRGTGISIDHYEAVRSQLPECDIRWEVPFQGGFLPDDTQELTVTSLTEADIDLLGYLPQLTTLHAEGCRDYAMLDTLMARRPDLTVTYDVEIAGVVYTPDTTALSYGADAPDLAELSEMLWWLPDLETIHFDQPAMPAEQLLSLREAHPHISITWQKDILGVTYDDTLTELDYTGWVLSGVEELDPVREVLPYFPSLEKMLLIGCGLDNETLAALREELRPYCKVVWSMKINGLTVRTDDLYFMPNKTGAKVSNYQVQNLKYCEDMLCIDLGHQGITDLSFLYGTPHLKYLIVADGPLLYIDAIGSLKELIYLELFMTEVNDYTPLLGCTALEDVNVCFTEGDITFFAQMPWLKTLWVNNCGASKADIKFLEEALPDTKKDFYSLCNYGGWRDLQNYFDMRDLLGMNYNAW